MQRRNFLKLATAIVATGTMPLGNASAAAATQVSPHIFPLETLQQHKLVIVSGPNQLGVDAAFKAFVQTRLDNGDRVSVLADKSLSDGLKVSDNTRGELWSADDLVPGLEEDCRLQRNAEARIYARILDDPDLFAIQHFSHGCQFNAAPVLPKSWDFLAETYMCGFSVATGMVASSTTFAAKIFVDLVLERSYRHAMENIHFLFAGQDHSEEFRRRVISAWSSVT